MTKYKKLLIAGLVVSCACLLQIVRAEDITQTNMVNTSNTNVLLPSRLYVGAIDSAETVVLGNATHPPEFVEDGAMFVKTSLVYYAALIREDFNVCEGCFSAFAKRSDYCGDRNILISARQYINKDEGISVTTNVQRRILQIRVPTVHFKRNEVTLILQYILSDKADGSNAWMILGVDRWVREKNKNGGIEWKVCPLTQTALQPPF